MQVERTCQNCGNKFFIIRWRLKDSRRGKFCSRDCAQLRTGENARRWQGGLTAKNYGPRQQREYRELRARLLVGGTCVDCGTSERLEVDHIVPIGIWAEGAFEPTNMQVLCEDCHKLKSRQDTKNIWVLKMVWRQYGRQI